KFSMMKPSIPPSASASASFNTESVILGKLNSFAGDPGNAGTCNMPIMGLYVSNIPRIKPDIIPFARPLRDQFAWRETPVRYNRRLSLQKPQRRKMRAWQDRAALRRQAVFELRERRRKTKRGRTALRY